jgi:CRISPR-associated protein Cmr5
MRNQSEIKKLEKGRAEFAYNCVKKALDGFKDDKTKQKDYRSYSRKIPTMILTNGLGQTLAFVKAKKAEKKKAYELFYNQMTSYFKTNNSTRIKMPDNKSDFVEWVISCDSCEYRYITQELLAFLNWLKRFAEGMIEGEER